MHNLRVLHIPRTLSRGQRTKCKELRYDNSSQASYHVQSEPAPPREILRLPLAAWQYNEYTHEPNVGRYLEASCGGFDSESPLVIMLKERNWSRGSSHVIDT